MRAKRRSLAAFFAEEMSEAVCSAPDVASLAMLAHGGGAWHNLKGCSAVPVPLAVARGCRSRARRLPRATRSI